MRSSPPSTDTLAVASVTPATMSWTLRARSSICAVCCFTSAVECSSRSLSIFDANDSTICWPPEPAYATSVISTRRRPSGMTPPGNCSLSCAARSESRTSCMPCSAMKKRSSLPRLASAWAFEL